MQFILQRSIDSKLPLLDTEANELSKQLQTRYWPISVFQKSWMLSFLDFVQNTKYVLSTLCSKFIVLK